MGRHHAQGATVHRARLSLGATALAGLIGSGTYALVVPAAAPVTEPAAAAVVVARPSTSCDLSGPPVFGDPAHPDEITNRDCGYADSEGRQRSRDPWIDDQLRDAGR